MRKIIAILVLLLGTWVTAGAMDQAEIVRSIHEQLGTRKGPPVDPTRRRYLEAVYKKITKNKRRLAGKEVGWAVVRFKIMRSGSVKNVELLKSSGVSAINQE